MKKGGGFSLMLKQSIMQVLFLETSIVLQQPEEVLFKDCPFCHTKYYEDVCSEVELHLNESFVLLHQGHP